MISFLVWLAIRFIDRSLNAGRKVLVHCNPGMSRSPGIGLLYLEKKKIIFHMEVDSGKRTIKFGDK